jgi:hypothetical protein
MLPIVGTMLPILLLNRVGTKLPILLLVLEPKVGTFYYRRT